MSVESLRGAGYGAAEQFQPLPEADTNVVPAGSVGDGERAVSGVRAGVDEQVPGAVRRR